jgi:hypothetical protein
MSFDFSNSIVDAFSPISIQADVFAAVAILASLVTWLTSNYFYNQKIKNERRVKEVLIAIEDLNRLFLKGRHLANDISRGKVEPERNTLISYCNEVLFAIELALDIKFEVWATKEERAILEKLKNESLAWGSLWSNNEITNPPAFDVLLNSIKNASVELGHSLKKSMR